MNNKVNYTLVGSLVLLALVLMISFTYWLMQPETEDEVTQYNIHFDESVLGLNIDAPVKYRGITVGKVASLGINPKNIEQVDVLISIIKSTPIREDTIAQLTAQGITGLSYINLSMGSREAKVLSIKEGDTYPVIKTLPSFLENIEQSFGSVSEQLSVTLKQTNKLLNDENQREVTLILKRTSSILEKIDRILDEETLSHIQSSVKNFDEISNKANNLTPQFGNFMSSSTDWEKKITNSFDSIVDSYTGIKSSIDEIKKVVKDTDIMPSMSNTFIDVEELMTRLDSFIESYEESPGDILFKKEELKEKLDE